MGTQEMQRQAKETSHRRKVNLFLKAQHMAYNLAHGPYPPDANAAKLIFCWHDGDGSPIPGTHSGEDFRVTRPPELRELWSNLSELPSEAIYEILAISRFLDHIDDYLDHVDLVPDNMRSPLPGWQRSVRQAAHSLLDLMNRQTGAVIRPRPDRDEFLYGSPEDDWDRE